jgi:hypothetical protein
MLSTLIPLSAYFIFFNPFDFNAVNAPIRCIPAVVDNRHTIIVINWCLWRINIMPPVFKSVSLIFNLH